MIQDQFFSVAIRVRKILQFEDCVAWHVNQNKLFTVQVPSDQDLLKVDSRERRKIIMIDQMEQQQFTYDFIETDEKTQTFYVKNCRNLLKQCSSGYHTTIMCYGQTTSGKTYTILGDQGNPGILPCALKDIFNWKQKQDMLIWVQYVQIYNEQMDDLLTSENSKPIIVDDQQWGTMIQGAQRIKVHSFEQAITLLNEGEERRIYRPTKIHDHSSRSHTVFKIVKISLMLTFQKYLQVTQSNKITYSCMNLVDLAGSEKLQENTTSSSQNETGYINKSLLCLTNVINKLAEKKQKKIIIKFSKHIPYRDSKLTRILKDSIGGNNCTLLICCISPAKNNFFQTLSTLQFANRAKLIKNTPSQHILLETENPKDKEISLLKQQLSEVMEENRLIKLENLQLTQQLQSQKSVQPLQTRNTNMSGNDKSTAKSLYSSITQESNNIIVSQFQTQQQDYSLYLWGSNQDGRLGLGNQIKISRTPMKINLQFTQVSCGSHHTLAITNNGQVYAWGRNQRGQLGIGSIDSVNEPFKIKIKDHIIQVSCGWQHSLALSSNGSIFTWGYGEDGQLGKGNYQSSNEPGVIKQFNAKVIQAGHSTSAFYNQDDELYTFGNNYDGRCMLTELTSICTPTLVMRNRIRNFSLGVSHMGVVLQSGQLIMAGVGTDGQLGVMLDENEPQTIIIDVPIEDLGGNEDQITYKTELASTGILVEKFQNGNCLQVACGDKYTLTLSTNGYAFVFGKSSFDRLGTETSENIFEPTPININSKVRQVLSGTRHAGVITNEGELYMWGFNFHNQLGLGDNDKDQPMYYYKQYQFLSPVRVELPGKIQQISLGYFHSAAIIEQVD